MRNSKFRSVAVGISVGQGLEDGMRDGLLKLPKETLVDALIELAGDSDRAADLIERVLSSQTENLSRFEQKLADLGRQNRYHD